MKLAYGALGAAAALAISACASAGAGRDSAAKAPPDWRSIATDEDRERIRKWRTAWIEGLAKARTAGHADVIAAEGPLLQPDTAIEWQTPAAGSYLCRTIKIGGKSEGMLDYVAYPAFACRITQDEGVMRLAKLTGSQRPIGRILPFDRERMVFLGTLQLGDEAQAQKYGRDRERDMAGIVERTGERRWRIAFPYPAFESTIDIMELVPDAD